MATGWLGLAFDLPRRQRRRRRGAAGGKRAVACLSAESASERSEFDRPRQTGAPEGTRAQPGPGGVR